MVNFNARIPNLAQNDGRELCMPRKQRNPKFLGHLDHFSKFLKFLKYFEKRSK
jgi:hypothetical protein